MAPILHLVNKECFFYEPWLPWMSSWLLIWGFYRRFYRFWGTLRSIRWFLSPKKQNKRSLFKSSGNTNCLVRFMASDSDQGAVIQSGADFKPIFRVKPILTQYLPKKCEFGSNFKNDTELRNYIRKVHNFESMFKINVFSEHVSKLLLILNPCFKV